MTETDRHRYAPAAAPRLSLAEVVDELVDSWRTRELVERFAPAPAPGAWPGCEVPLRWIRYRAVHEVRHPPLLEQLAATTNDSTAGLDDRVVSAPGPRAGARLDALATLARIGEESEWWLHRLGRPVPASVRDRLLDLVGVEVLGRDVLDVRDRSLAAAARGWRTAARVITTWDCPPWSPAVPCPSTECEAMSSLRVRLNVETNSATASCVECGRTWDEQEVATLGEYVAWATVHLAGFEHRVLVDGSQGEQTWEVCSYCLPIRDAMADRYEQRRDAARQEQQAARLVTAS